MMRLKNSFILLAIIAALMPSALAQPARPHSEYIVYDNLEYNDLFQSPIGFSMPNAYADDETNELNFSFDSEINGPGIMNPNIDLFNYEATKIINPKPIAPTKRTYTTEPSTTSTTTEYATLEEKQLKSNVIEKLHIIPIQINETKMHVTTTVIPTGPMDDLLLVEKPTLWQNVRSLFTNSRAKTAHETIERPMLLNVMDNLKETNEFWQDTKSYVNTNYRKILKLSSNARKEMKKQAKQTVHAVEQEWQNLKNFFNL